MSAFDPDAAADYLRERGVLDGAADVRRLGGGVSNHVIAVTWPEGCVVLKHPLPNLAVEDDWPADVERVHNEAAAARAYADALADTDLPVRVPEVLFEDRERHVVGLECAPDSRTWKADLLDGVVDRDLAATVGRVLGVVQTAAAGDEGLRAAFASRRPFEQLRLDPYHRTTARRHPDVADEIRAEIERVEGVERTLVHGDYSPKNLLVGEAAWVLDFEVAHWGDPAFDAAFVLNHLLIKSVYNHGQGSEYEAAARDLWEAYREAVAWDVEYGTVRELAVLMLARVDGKSPVEYVTTEPVKEALRAAAKRALRDGTDDLDAFFAHVARERDRL
ncbi:MAG: phosphotransferase family protein [Halobacteriaceae archaeon]